MALGVEQPGKSGGGGMREHIKISKRRSQACDRRMGAGILEKIGDQRIDRFSPPPPIEQRLSFRREAAIDWGADFRGGDERREEVFVEAVAKAGVVEQARQIG